MFHKPAQPIVALHNVVQRVLQLGSASGKGLSVLDLGVLAVRALWPRAIEQRLKPSQTQVKRQRRWN